MVPYRYQLTDGTHIRLKRSKTGRRVAIKVGAPLKAALDTAVKVKVGPLILVNSLNRVRERFVGQRTGIMVRQELRFLRAELPGILATRTDALLPRMLRILEDLMADWRRLDARIEDLSSEIEALARQDKGCARLSARGYP